LPNFLFNFWILLNYFNHFYFFSFYNNVIFMYPNISFVIFLNFKILLLLSNWFLKTLTSKISGFCHLSWNFIFFKHFYFSIGLWCQAEISKLWSDMLGRDEMPLPCLLSEAVH
jgi:hypothetical protein